LVNQTLQKAQAGFGSGLAVGGAHGADGGPTGRRLGYARR